MRQLLAAIRGVATGNASDEAAGRPRGYRAPRAGVSGRNAALTTADASADAPAFACRDPVREEEAESLIAPLLRPLTRDSGHVDHQPLLVIVCLLATLDGASRFAALVRCFAMDRAGTALTTAEACLLSGAIQRAASAFWPLWSAGQSAPRADVVEGALVRRGTTRLTPLTHSMLATTQRQHSSPEAAVEEVLADDAWFGLLEALPARLEAAAAVRPAAVEGTSSARGRAPPRASAPLVASTELERSIRGTGSVPDGDEEDDGADTDSSSEGEVKGATGARVAAAGSADPALWQQRRLGPWWGLPAWGGSRVECVDPAAPKPGTGATREGVSGTYAISAPQGPAPPPSWLRVPPPVVPRAELEWTHGLSPPQAARGTVALRDPARDEELVATPAGRAVMLHHVAETEQRAYLGHAGRVTCVAAADDGTTLASGHVADAPSLPSAAVPLVHVWRPGTMEPVALLLPSSPRWRGALQLAFCGPSQRYILVVAALWRGAAPDAAPVSRPHPTLVADECGAADRPRTRTAHELVLLDWHQRRVLWAHGIPSAAVRCIAPTE